MAADWENGIMQEPAMPKQVKENPYPYNWVVEIEEMVLKADPSLEMERWNKPSIYQVPEQIGQKSKSQTYEPQVVSLGPFHHGKRHLLPMEEHKRRAVVHMIKRSGREPRTFATAIAELADELQGAYENLDEEWRGENLGRFVAMMVTDGCFLLEFMRTHKKDGVVNDYAPNDPVFSEHGIIYFSLGIRTDMVVVENQLPLLVLKRLVAVQNGYMGNEDINNMVLNFMWRPNLEGSVHLGFHPLEIYHKSFCGLQTDHQTSVPLEDTDTTPSAVELSNAGIHFRRNKTDSVHDIDFENGVLFMPLTSIHEDTEKILLNLMAFEQLYGKKRTDVLSYVFFMDNLINTESDVALLRSNGVMKNRMSSDKAVVELFSNLTMGARMSPSSKLNDVHRQLSAYYRKPWNKWRANFIDTYLSNPWVFISLVAAIILLVATLLQTVYSIMPFYNKI